MEDLVIIPKVLGRRRFLKGFPFQQRHVRSSRVTSVGKRFAIRFTTTLRLYYTLVCTAHRSLYSSEWNIRKLITFITNITGENCCVVSVDKPKNGALGASFYARNIWIGLPLNEKLLNSNSIAIHNIKICIHTLNVIWFLFTINKLLIFIVNRKIIDWSQWAMMYKYSFRFGNEYNFVFIYFNGDRDEIR